MRLTRFLGADTDGARRARTAFIAALVTGLLLRLAVACFPRYVSGDELWYQAFARVIVDGAEWHAQDAGLAVGPFQRPPGYAAWLACVFAVFGDVSMMPARVANACVSSASPILVALLARAAFPRARRTLPVFAAWAQALNFVDIRIVQTLMSENLCTPLCIVSVLAALHLARRPSVRWALTLGVAAAGAAYMRADAPSVTAGAGVAAIVMRGRRRGVLASGIGHWMLAGGLAVSLCLPWCAYLHRSTGRVAFMADLSTAEGVKERDGWLSWLSNSIDERRDWLQLYWFGPHAVDPDWIPGGFYRLPGEREEVLVLLARARAAGRIDPSVDAEFAVIAARRRAAEPLRFLVVLPALRTAQIWLHPTDDDFPRSMEPRSRSIFSWAIEVALRLVRPFAGLGFFVCVWWLLRGRDAAGPAVVAAGAVVARSVVMVWWLPLTSTWGMYEARYVAVVQPIALLATVAAIHHLWSASGPPWRLRPRA